MSRGGPDLHQGVIGLRRVQREVLHEVVAQEVTVLHRAKISGNSLQE